MKHEGKTSVVGMTQFPPIVGDSERVLWRFASSFFNTVGPGSYSSALQFPETVQRSLTPAGLRLDEATKIALFGVRLLTFTRDRDVSDKYRRVGTHLFRYDLSAGRLVGPLDRRLRIVGATIREVAKHEHSLCIYAGHSRIDELHKTLSRISEQRGPGGFCTLDQAIALFCSGGVTYLPKPY